MLKLYSEPTSQKIVHTKSWNNDCCIIIPISKCSYKWDWMKENCSPFSHENVLHQTVITKWCIKQLKITWWSSSKQQMCQQRVHLRTPVLTYWHHVPYLWRLLSIINYSKIQFAMTNCHTYHSIKFRKINLKILTKSRYESTGSLSTKRFSLQTL